MHSCDKVVTELHDMSAKGVAEKQAPFSGSMHPDLHSLQSHVHHMPDVCQRCITWVQVAVQLHRS